MIKVLYLLLGLFFFMSSTSAQVQVYTGVGEYIMSDFDTPDVAKQRAKVYAERNAQEQAGVYVESTTNVLNSQVTKDEINTMTAGILKILETNYQTLPSPDSSGIMIRATIKAEIDSDDVNKWFKRDEVERSTLVAQNKQLKKAIYEQENLILKLKQQIANIKTQKDREKIASKYAEADKEFLSNQKIEEGNKFYIKGDLDKALSSYNEAIKLNPNNYLAYSNRSVVYNDRKQYEKSIEDCNKSIKLNSKYSLSYYNRGLDYQNLQDYEKSIQDYTKAVELDSNLLAAYSNRGLILYAAQYYDQALKDYNKIIEINPNFAIAYNNRNLIYVALNDLNSALNDVNKAIELKPDYAEAYYNRGNVYYYLQYYQRALKDYEKALEINPNFTQADYNRNVVLSIINKRSF